MAEQTFMTESGARERNTHVMKSQEKPTAPEDRIQSPEKELGIRSESDRAMEASLFVDHNFLTFAVITGKTDHPERIFGSHAWEDYLSGRLFAKEYGDQELTTDFVSELHKRLTGHEKPGTGGVVRGKKLRGSSYDTNGPVAYTKEQIAAINENPLLEFEPVSDDPDEQTGFINYPHTGHRAQIKAAVTEDLRGIVRWFNEEKAKKTYDPHEVAAMLQRKLVSLHPFTEGNGRLSRTLMNWSLENDGVAPSVIENPNDDILLSEQEWVERVRDGSALYTARRDRKDVLDEAGVSTPSSVFNLGQEQAFYQYVFQHVQNIPDIATSGEKHSHEAYNALIADFQSEFGTFQDFVKSEATSYDNDGKKHILTQGGLVTPESVAFSMKSQSFVPEHVRDEFYTDVLAYRGAMVEGDVNDEQVLQMFLRPIAAGSGYRAVVRQGRSATSQAPMKVHAIAESMDYYNKMVASAYLYKKHGYIPPPYPAVEDLALTVGGHVADSGDILKSPFASTSLNPTISRQFAQQFASMHAQKAKHGVVFKARIPKFGVIMTHGSDAPDALKDQVFHHPSEREILVAGAIQPASLDGLEVYDRSGFYAQASLVASRSVEDGEIHIHIDDMRGDFVTKRVYTYNETTRRFELTDEVATDQPVVGTQRIVIKPDAIKDYLIKYAYNESSPFAQASSAHDALHTAASEPFFTKEDTDFLAKGEKNPHYKLFLSAMSHGFKEEVEHSLTKYLLSVDTKKVHSLTDLAFPDEFDTLTHKLTKLDFKLKGEIPNQ